MPYIGKQKETEKYRKDYDSNKESSYLTYRDANNLYE